jgi:hypothetical protein
MQAFESSRLAGAAHARRSLATKTLDRKPRDLPELKLNHLLRMTDSTGIFQHAAFSTPNFLEGYCIDDNARALVLTVLLGEAREDQQERMRTLATTYVSFMHYALMPATNRFHNHMSFDRRWLDPQGSEDSHGRALWALGVCVGRSPFRTFHMLAAQLFAQTLPPVAEFTSPRAWAFTLIGIHEYLRRLGGDVMVKQMREVLTTRLMAILDAHSFSDWHWFETELSYDNAKLAHALILSGTGTARTDVFERGLKTLRWLVEMQTSERGHFRPIGSNGFHVRGGPRADFDQQPIEAQATVSACLCAYRATSDVWWYEQAQKAFDWFLGWNDLGLEIYQPETGGCADGLHIDRVNENQGAESTLAFLLSLVEMRQAQNMVTSFREPTANGK